MRRLAFLAGPAVVLCLALLAACTPRFQDLGPASAASPRLGEREVVMDDGTSLPVEVWRAARPRAAIVAVHGFNGYSEDFALPGPWLARHGLTVYTYDQRGFGRTPQRGLWPGTERMVADLKAMVALARARNPGRPVYVLGISMGGAVTMAAMADGLKPDGAILVAPAVWGWETMNPVYTSTLWLAAHTVPWLELTGEGVEVWPSDNIEMLRAYARDPLNIKATRVDTLYGLVSLMDDAYLAADRFDVPVLYLYGEHDELVPEKPTRETMERIAAPKRTVIYENGWHMLLRDKQRERVYRDVLAWIRDRGASLPSGEEVAAASDR